MPRCTIKRYAKGETRMIDCDLPTHVSQTGNENFFEKARHDALMIMRGMEFADKITFEATSEQPPRYWIHSLTLD
ncbi:MAG TPA: hypothetical protein VE079_15825 [Ensifer sp.]|nr:hypothetical protein [Ensifer sp.]